MEGMAIGHIFERGPSKDHSSKVWSNLAQWFLRRRLKCEKLTTDDGRKKPDGKSSQIEISSNGQNCCILSQNVPKFELYQHNDELFNIC
jgi:hypothetical protein